jgi:hypothetical protein
MVSEPSLNQIFMDLVSASFSSSSASTVSSTHTFSIKLNSKIYLTWKTQFVPILNYQELNGFVDGTLPAPPKIVMSSDDDPSPIPNPEYERWFKKDQMLLS